jgi:hypothetical protein
MSDKNSTTHGYNDLELALNKQAPKSATKVYKKRGRKGEQVIKAFKAIPTTMVDAEKYAESYGITVASLRQIKRYDPVKETGQVFVRKILKGENKGKMMVWREPPKPPTESK